MDDRNERHEQHTLPDGRALGWCQHGDPDGRPVLYFHGFFGSRLEPSPVAGALAEAGIRMIAVDRPGAGLSDRCVGRRLLDWPDDVAHLCDTLGVERFHCVGVSAGGPYALACARALPRRVARVALICGMCPLDVPGVPLSTRLFFDVGRISETVAAWSVAPTTWWFPDDPAAVAKAGARLPAPDRALMEDPANGELLLALAREGMRQGARGAAEECRVLGEPWGFALEDVDVEVDLHLAELDHKLPVEVGRAMAERLPHATLEVHPGEGHLSLPFHQLVRLSRALLC